MKLKNNNIQSYSHSVAEGAGIRSQFKYLGERSITD
jgi:hypothetical protein